MNVLFKLAAYFVLQIENESTSPMQYTPCRRKNSVKSKSSPSSRKTPSPQYKILPRRSPSNLARNLQDEFNEKAPPICRSPTSVNNRLNNNVDVQTLDISSSEKLNADTYAGARFHSPPSPHTLPKPPTHWINATCVTTVSPMLNAPFLDSIAVHLKGLLNVQA